jgi:hypothetical protein
MGQVQLNFLLEHPYTQMPFAFRIRRSEAPGLVEKLSYFVSYRIELLCCQVGL